ncbi:uncharacterized protein [Heterodontus francisci]|uniref:uncharacterized protein n=1 Tax=Heterodontus francisci TaxID=7792 RepID=UPI00355C95A3
MNDIMHKRCSLNDTKQSLLQHEWKNSSQSQHLEKIKSGSQTVNRIPRSASIVSQRKAFFESHLKLPIPVTKDPTKHGKILNMLKLCNPDPAGSSIVGCPHSPCHFSKDDHANIVEAKVTYCSGTLPSESAPRVSESGKECDIQKHSAIVKGRQLIGLYQAICEKVRQTDSKQAISVEEVTVPHKEKPSQTLQERLQYLLSEESDNQEEKELRSKQQCFIQRNSYKNVSVTESLPNSNLPLQTFNKYDNMGLTEPKSAFIHERTDCIPRVTMTGISCQGSLALDRVHGRLALDTAPNNALVFSSNNTGLLPCPMAGSSSGEQELDSPHLSSLIQSTRRDSVSTGTTTLSQIEDIRQHLQSLEADYRELVTLLSRDSRTGPAHRKLMHKQKGQSPVKNGKLLAQLTLQRQKDICTVQRRFGHLEAHILLLTRNIAQLADAIGSQTSLLQKMHSMQQEIQKTQHAYNNVAGDSDRLSTRQNPSSISELSQYCGERPSMMTIFLKKLGYEQYVAHFENAGIGLMELPYLNEERLAQLGIPLGPRLRILHEVTTATYV